jgi:hypothetical protein
MGSSSTVDEKNGQPITLISKTADKTFQPSVDAHVQYGSREDSRDVTPDLER